MSQVGVPGFTTARDAKRRTIRQRVNEMDKSTVVSIFPLAIDEKKWTISPGRFMIPPGSFKDPQLLVVGPSSWWKDTGWDEPILEIPTHSGLIAESIVRDYCNGIPECNMGNQMPGLFYIPGEITKTEVQTKFASLLSDANTKQRKWFDALIRLADSLWSRTNGNPRAISDIMRLAAKEMGQETREWIAGFEYVGMVRCVACGAFRDPNFPICRECKAIVDPEKAKSLNLTFAQ